MVLYSWRCYAFRMGEAIVWKLKRESICVPMIGVGENRNGENRRHVAKKKEKKSKRIMQGEKIETVLNFREF